MGTNSLAVVGHAGPQLGAEEMSAPSAWAALAALGQPTRLEIFRLLVRGDPEGLAAGAVAETVGCPHNTFSTHIAILARAGLVRGSRQGRTIIYRADATGIRALIRFLVTDCCDGRPELCGLAGLATNSEYACGPTPKKKKRGRK